MNWTASSKLFHYSSNKFDGNLVCKLTYFWKYPEISNISSPEVVFLQLFAETWEFSRQTSLRIVDFVIIHQNPDIGFDFLSKNKSFVQFKWNPWTIEIDLLSSKEDPFLKFKLLLSEPCKYSLGKPPQSITGTTSLQTGLDCLRF